MSPKSPDLSLNQSTPASAKSAGAGVLLIHGFCGSPHEVAPLRERLNTLGFLTEAPLLPDHGRSGVAIGRVSRLDWIAAAEEAYLSLLKRRERVFVVGFSMGGLVAVGLNARHTLDALVTVNTPVYYWNPGRIAKNLSLDFPFYIKKYMTSADAMPPAAMWQFQRLLSESKPLFNRVRCPALIVQAGDDDTVQPYSARRLYNSFSGQKYLFTHPSGGHQLLLSTEGPTVMDRIERFLTGLL